MDDDARSGVGPDATLLALALVEVNLGDDEGGLAVLWPDSPQGLEDLARALVAVATNLATTLAAEAHLPVGHVLDGYRALVLRGEADG